MCEHDERFTGVFGAKNGCLACELEQAQEWINSVSAAVKSAPEFAAGQWAGDKEGWGYHHEVVRWLVGVRDAVAKHHSQHADDLCYMDDDELYAVAGLPARDATVGDPRAMLRNCKRFIRNRCFGGGPWKSYAELEAEVERLTKLLEIKEA